uniref:Ribonuclease II/R domain-containing protein n=1 Tax=Romanomermis culicivorax TaxID=13658 RepID=A0A915HL83_ROMCU
GTLRINPRNFEEAYISDPASVGNDIFIEGLIDRNRALHGDTVMVKVKNKEKWRMGSLKFLIVRQISSFHFKNRYNREALLRINEFCPGCRKVDDKFSKKLKNIEFPDTSQFPVLSVIKIPELRAILGIKTPKALFRETMINDDGSVSSDTVKVAMPTTTKRQYTTVSSLKDKEVDENCLLKTAEVVYIAEKVHSRMAAGCLKRMQDKNSNFALFSPNDPKMPRLMIPMSECPPQFDTRPQDFERMLYIARLTEWGESSKFAKGTLVKHLGFMGDIEAETEGMLAEYGVDSSDFDSLVIDCLPTIPEGSSWCIPPKEFEYREDFRKELLFTIDPKTARDLDDALHVKQLEKDIFEVGVHIADVSFFVSPKSALDMAALSRATSVYLVHKVIPMLPRLLCEELCSLNPGVDRLAFSVVWKMNLKGDIFEERFTRSLEIRSEFELNCEILTNFSQFQLFNGFIREPDRQWTKEEMPPITGRWTPDEICRTVNILQAMAVELRKKRLQSGALRIDQPKLTFSLDKETGLPNGCSIYELKDSNKLIEEFMLLANMAVAHRIYKFYPEVALLRRHSPPKAKVMKQIYIKLDEVFTFDVVFYKRLKAFVKYSCAILPDFIVSDLSQNLIVSLCSQFGLKLDPTNSSTLQKSLEEHRGQSERAKNIWAVLMQLISKTMQLAVYFCTGAIEDEAAYHHWALSVPLYTHFTSPIRRYPDLMVHRLLAATLEYSPVPDLPTENVEKAAVHCNNKKVAAKTISDLSAEMFFTQFVIGCGPLELAAVVIGVMDRSFDVVITKFGLTRRVYCDKMKGTIWSFDGDKENCVGSLTLTQLGTGKTRVLQVFDDVDVILFCRSGSCRLEATLKMEGNDIPEAKSLPKPMEDMIDILCDLDIAD